MKKDELQTGMVCQLRNGELYIVMTDTISYCDYIYNPITCNQISLDSYSDDLTCYCSNNKYDIMKVYKDVKVWEMTSNRFNIDRYDFIWYRKEPLEVTMEEVEAKFGCPVKIVGDKK